jgi:hypothetical protein
VQHALLLLDDDERLPVATGAGLPLKGQPLLHGHPAHRAQFGVLLSQRARAASAGVVIVHIRCQRAVHLLLPHAFERQPLFERLTALRRGLTWIGAFSAAPGFGAFSAASHCAAAASTAVSSSAFWTVAPGGVWRCRRHLNLDAKRRQGDRSPARRRRRRAGRNRNNGCRPHWGIMRALVDHVRLPRALPRARQLLRSSGHTRCCVCGGPRPRPRGQAGAVLRCADRRTIRRTAVARTAPARRRHRASSCRRLSSRPEGRRHGHPP